MVLQDLVKDTRSDDEGEEQDGTDDSSELREKDRGNAVKPTSSAMRLNGKPKAPLPAGISSAVDKNTVLNGSAVESAPGTPRTPTMPAANGLVAEPLSEPEGLKKR